MDTKDPLIAFLALFAAGFLPWVMQLFKLACPRVVCGKVMLRGLSAVFCLVVVVALSAWLGELLPTWEALGVVAARGVSLFLAVQGAYYLTRKPEEAETDG